MKNFAELLVLTLYKKPDKRDDEKIHLIQLQELMFTPRNFFQFFGFVPNLLDLRQITRHSTIFRTVADDYSQ